MVSASVAVGGDHTGGVEIDLGQLGPIATGINRARRIDREVRLQRSDFFAAIGDNQGLLAGRAHPLAGLGVKLLDGNCLHAKQSVTGDT